MSASCAGVAGGMHGSMTCCPVCSHPSLLEVRSRDTVECDHCGHVVEERRRDVADVTISAKVDKMLCVVLDDLAEKTILEDIPDDPFGTQGFITAFHQVQSEEDVATTATSRTMSGFLADLEKQCSWLLYEDTSTESEPEFSLNVTTRRGLIACFLFCHDLCDLFCQPLSVAVQMIHILKSTVYSTLFRLRAVEVSCCAALLLVQSLHAGGQTPPHFPPPDPTHNIDPPVTTEELAFVLSLKEADIDRAFQLLRSAWYEVLKCTPELEDCGGRFSLPRGAHHTFLSPTTTTTTTSSSSSSSSAATSSSASVASTKSSTTSSVASTSSSSTAVFASGVAPAMRQPPPLEGGIEEDPFHHHHLLSKGMSLSPSRGNSDSHGDGCLLSAVKSLLHEKARLLQLEHIDQSILVAVFMAEKLLDAPSQLLAHAPPKFQDILSSSQGNSIMAAATMYLACLLQKEAITQRTIADLFQVVPKLMRQACRVLCTSLSPSSLPPDYVPMVPVAEITAWFLNRGSTTPAAAAAAAAAASESLPAPPSKQHHLVNSTTFLGGNISINIHP